MALALCASCARHVRSSDAVCPFCGVNVSGGTGGSSPIRISRSMALAGGVIVAAGAALAACAPVAAYGCPTPTCGPPDSSMTDAGMEAAQAAYGGPPVDASDQ